MVDIMAAVIMVAAIIAVGITAEVTMAVVITAVAITAMAITAEATMAIADTAITILTRAGSGMATGTHMVSVRAGAGRRTMPNTPGSATEQRDTRDLTSRND
jgi:hypothetical protein